MKIHFIKYKKSPFDINIVGLQVMVLDPLVIPQFIEVVIGECLFELQFRVEKNMDSDSPVPVDMDDLSRGEDENKSDQLEDVARGGNSAPDSGKSVSEGAGNDGNTGKKGVVHNVISSVVQHTELGLGKQGVKHAGNPTQAVVPATSPRMAVSVSCTPDVAAMAAVPEATLGLTESGRSKRRNKSRNEDNMQRASKLKVAHNLDADIFAGNSIRSLPYVLIPDEVVQRLTSLGFVCENNDKSWDKFLELLTNKLSGESGSIVDAKSVALERERERKKRG
jgi:hypothetical protein